MDLAAQLTPRVEVTLGGRSWRLCLTHRVLLECEELTGLSLLAGANLSSARLIRVLLYCALKRAGATYTLEQVGAFIRPRTLSTIQQAINAAWLSAMPEPEPQSLTYRTGRETAEAFTWLNAWSMARFDLRLGSDEWLDMTPRQLYALKQRQLAQWRREELLVGIVAATTANFSMCHPRSPIRADSFMLHPFKQEPERQQTVEDVMSVFAMFRNNGNAPRQSHAA
jgi:hypothetical protein